MKDLKIKIVLIVFFILVLIQNYFKNDFIFYSQIVLLILLIPILIKRIIDDFRDNSKLSKENYGMIVNIFMVILFLVIGYFLITEKLKV